MEKGWPGIQFADSRGVPGCVLQAVRAGGRAILTPAQPVRQDLRSLNERRIQPRRRCRMAALAQTPGDGGRPAVALGRVSASRALCSTPLMKASTLIASLCLFAGACTGTLGSGVDPSSPSSLRLAAWNIEHLAEANGSGCRPRTDADYAALRVYVAELDADVIAFQEVESKTAAERVFDPAIYTVVIEERVGSNRQSACRGREGLTINAQRTGFAVRKGIPFERQPDFTELQVGDADLRSGVDLIVRPRGGEPIRVLSVHLKSGCSSGDANEACPVLFQQVPVVEGWIDQRANESVRFAVMGDFNRRLTMPNDAVWAEWDDASPPNADLALASGDRSAQCNPRYRDFIDFIVLDREANADLLGFTEKTFASQPLSDHCAVLAELSLR